MIMYTHLAPCDRCGQLFLFWHQDVIYGEGEEILCQTCAQHERDEKVESAQSFIDDMASHETRPGRR